MKGKMRPVPFLPSADKSQMAVEDLRGSRKRQARGKKANVRRVQIGERGS